MGAAEEIAKYHELLKSGAITEEEFAQFKASQISGSSAQSGGRGFAAMTQPIAADSPTKSRMKDSTRPTPRIQNGASSLQMGASVAAGYVGGHLIADRLLNNDQTTEIITGTTLFANGEMISAAAIEMPNGDVFYSVTDTITYQGVLTQDEVIEINSESDAGSYNSGEHDSDASEGFSDFF